MFECYLCLQKSVLWCADFDFDDYGLDGIGIVHVYKCQNCGASITYEMRYDEQEAVTIGNSAVVGYA